MELDRRDFLKMAGGAAASVLLAQLGLRRLLVSAEEISPFPVEWIPKVPQWASTICQQCTGGCSVRVKLIEGRAINIEGNPLYPVNQGGICPKGIAGLQALYDPDRIKGPMKQVGKRGEGKWQRISWEEAIQEVATRLKTLREKGETHKLAIWGGQYRGLMDTLFARFAEAFGTPNYIKHTSCLDGSAMVNYLMQGNRSLFGYDLENTNYILSFGTSLLEAWWSPVRTARAYGYLRQGRPGHRAKIVQVDTRFSMTAAKADTWIPIHLGTDGALALGIAQVMVKEGLYNQRFVAEHTFGFEDWTDESGETHQGWRSFLEQYSLEQISRMTGVPVKTIIQLAREFAAAQSAAIALAERGASMQWNGIYNRMAIHALNALVGSIDVPGGVVFPREVPLQPLPAVPKDSIAEQGLRMPRIDLPAPSEQSPPLFPLARNIPQLIPENLLQDKPYPIDTLFLYYTNPLFSLPPTEKTAQAFAKIPFIVSFSPFLDESSAQADLILPDHTYLERWQDDPMLPIAKYTLFGLGKPVVKPLYDTQATGDILLTIAHQIGGVMQEAFPWKSFPEVIQYSVKGIFEARRGNIVETFTEEPWTELLARRGVWNPSYQTFEELWEQLMEKGGWWDPTYSFGEWGRIFQTPSGKFEFFSQTLRKRLEDWMQERQEPGIKLSTEKREEILTALKLGVRGDQLYLPHFEPPPSNGDNQEYPFYLNTYKLMTQGLGRGANHPFLQEIIGLHVQVKWDSWVEINPETAHQLGIADGDLVWVESAQGKIQVRAKLYPGAMPDVVNIPFGQGHTAYGRWAANRGANPNQLIAGIPEPLAGFPTWFSTRVKVYKAVEKKKWLRIIS